MTKEDTLTKEDILELVREARLGNVLCHNSVEGDRVWIEGADWHDELERFAELLEAKVRADEREACAKVAEETVCDMHLPTGVKIYGTRAAKTIRARGKK